MHLNTRWRCVVSIAEYRQDNENMPVKRNFPTSLRPKILTGQRHAEEDGKHMLIDALDTLQLLGSMCEDDLPCPCFMIGGQRLLEIEIGEKIQWGQGCGTVCR